MLNAVMLDQAHHISTIVFQNRAALRKALEYYLDMPTQTNGVYSMKTCSGRADSPMFLMLKKLEHTAQLLRSNVKAKYHISPLGDEDDRLRFIDALTQMLDDLSSVPDNPFPVCMDVLLEGLTGLELNITDIHAIESIVANYLPDFPDLVFAGIQEASQGQNNQSVSYSASIPRTMWRLAWDAICAIASEESSENGSLVLEAIRNEIAEFNDTSSQRTFQLSKSWPNEALVQTRKELNFESSLVSQAGQKNSKPNHASLQESMSRSNIGPRKAFNQLRNEFTSDTSLAPQISPHIFETKSNHTSTKEKLYISITDMVGVSYDELARNKSATAHVNQQRRRRQVYQTGCYSGKQAPDHNASVFWETILWGHVKVLCLIILLSLIILVFFVFSCLNVVLFFGFGIMSVLLILVFGLLSLGFRLLASIISFLFGL